jgi:hypothetical protein
VGSLVPPEDAFSVNPIEAGVNVEMEGLETLLFYPHGKVSVKLCTPGVPIRPEG